jgi:transposase InsO family protein
MDFVSDSLHDGRRFRVLTLVDHFSRVSPAIEVGSSITGKRVVAVLERLVKAHGLPRVITTDNGSEFTSRAVDEWAHRSGVKLVYSSREAHRERVYRELQRSASAGVFEPVLVLLPGGCEDQDRGVADRLQRAASAHVFGQPDARAIRVGMAAIKDPEGGNFLNFRLDQGWGEAQEGIF